MFRWALNHLRMIRYYSANRRRTVWTVAMDVGLGAAVVLAWPTVWAADQFYIRTDPATVISGKVYQYGDGAFRASLSGSDLPFELIRDSVFYANFTFSIAGQRRGWPFVSSHRQPEPLLEMDVFWTGQSKQIVDLPNDSPVRMAIAAAMFQGGHIEEVEFWRGGSPGADHRIATWVANGIVWTFVLTLLVGVSVSTLRFGWLFVAVGRSADRNRRKLEGMCTACGYDLRGNQFGERCPECGTLTQ